MITIAELIPVMVSDIMKSKNASYLLKTPVSNAITDVVMRDGVACILLRFTPVDDEDL